MCFMAFSFSPFYNLTEDADTPQRTQWLPSCKSGASRIFRKSDFSIRIISYTNVCIYKEVS